MEREGEVEFHVDLSTNSRASTVSEDPSSRISSYQTSSSQMSQLAEMECPIQCAWTILLGFGLVIFLPLLLLVVIPDEQRGGHLTNCTNVAHIVQNYSCCGMENCICGECNPSWLTCIYALQTQQPGKCCQGNWCCRYERCRWCDKKTGACGGCENCVQLIQNQQCEIVCRACFHMETVQNCTTYYDNSTETSQRRAQGACTGGNDYACLNRWLNEQYPLGHSFLEWYRPGRNVAAWFFMVVSGLCVLACTMGWMATPIYFCRNS